MNESQEERAKSRCRCNTPRWMQAVLKAQLTDIEDKLDTLELDALQQWMPASTTLVLRQAGKPWNQ